MDQFLAVLLHLVTSKQDLVLVNSVAVVGTKYAWFCFVRPRFA